MKKKMIFVMMTAMLFLLVGCQKEEMKLKNESVTVEYGNAISLKVEDYLENKKEFLNNVKVTAEIENEKDREYPKVGEYEIALVHGSQTQKVKVVVKDTVAPKLDIKDRYTVEYNSKLDLKELKASDLSKTTIILDDSKVNYKNAGTYKATVTAKDSSNNETKKEIEIVVKEEKKETSVKKSNIDNSSSSKSQSSSSKGSSSAKSSEKSHSSQSSSSEKELKPGQWESKVDKDSYVEIMGGNGSAWGGSGVLPEGY